MRWLITETCEYLVEAETRDEAEALFLEHGPGDAQTPLIGVTERTIEPADAPV